MGESCKFFNSTSKNSTTMQNGNDDNWIWLDFGGSVFLFMHLF